MKIKSKMKIKSDIQVRAFKSIFKWAVLNDEMSLEAAFAYAICATSDEAFAKADPELIRKWQAK